MSDYYNRHGEPMTPDEWAQSYETRREYKRVAATVLPSGYWVSTVWLGLNHQYGDGPPLIFESMVFPCDANGEVTGWGELDSDRYSTEAEALAGHQRLVEKWAVGEPKETCRW